MFDKLIAFHTLELIRDSLELIEKRCSDIYSVDDFLLSDSGMMKLDSVCMKLTAIGESIKNLDKITNKELLVKYPEHHYFDVDADEIFRICKEDIPQLYKVIIKIINDLK